MIIGRALNIYFNTRVRECVIYRRQLKPQKQKKKIIRYNTILRYVSGMFTVLARGSREQHTFPNRDTHADKSISNRSGLRSPKIPDFLLPLLLSPRVR